MGGGVVDYANAGYIEHGEGDADVSMSASVWGEDGNSRVVVQVMVGDLVEFKQNGRLGTVRGTVEKLGSKAKPLGLRVLVAAERRRWISNRLCSIVRDGKRVYR